MPSKTKQSGRAEILVRMAPKLKARIVAAATEDGLTTNDWLLDVIEEALAVRDGEVAANKKRALLEQRLEMKLQEIMVALAGGNNMTSLSARAQIKLQEKAEAMLAKWRDYADSDHHAEPRTALERLCKEHEDLQAELEGARRISTFGDEGFADPDDPDDDGDEPEPEDELAAPGDPDDGE